MGKNNYIAWGIVIFLVILLFKLGLFSVLNISDSTTYSSISYSKDTITYSNLDRNGLLNGWTSTHRIGENIDFTNAGDDSSGNRGLFVPYLEMNGINSDSFNAGGYKHLACVFTPKDITPTVPLYNTELTNLGFAYMSESIYEKRFPGETTICGFSSGYCLSQGTRYGNYPTCCIPLEQNVVVGKNACWTKTTFDASKLNEMASKMTCNVKGDTALLCSTSPVGALDRCVVSRINYNIQGKVSYNSGFVCEVNETELFNQLPKTMIQPSDGRNVSVAKIGINELSTAEFKLAKQVTYYRLTNNLCSPVLIWENQKTANDYLTQSECQSKIVCLNGDLDCSGTISRNELGVSVTKWLQGLINRENLSNTIQLWSNQ